MWSDKNEWSEIGMQLGCSWRFGVGIIRIDWWRVGVCEELDSVGLRGGVRLNERARSGNSKWWNNDNKMSKVGQ